MKYLYLKILAILFFVLCSARAQEGSILWSTSSIGDNLEAMPAVDASGNVYILAGNKLYSYTSSGELRWGGPKEAKGGDANSVSVSNDNKTIYSPGLDGIRAFDAESGLLKWSSNVFFNEGFGSVVCESLDGKVLYIGSGADHIGSVIEYIYAINASTGNYFWRKAVDLSDAPECCRGLMAGCSIDALGNVYLPGQDGILYSFKDNSLEYIENWTFDLGSESRMPVAIDNEKGFIYASSNTSVLYKLSTSGSVLASKNVAASQEIFAALVLSPDGNTIYVNAEDAKLHALITSDFTEKWAYTFEGWGSDPLVRDDGVILVMGQLNGAGRVCAIRDDVNFGTLLWSSDKILNSLTLNETNVNIGPEGNIYVHSGDQSPRALFAIQGNGEGLSTESPWAKSMGNIQNNGNNSLLVIDIGVGVEENCTFVVNTNDFESGWGIWNDGGSDARRSSRDANYANGRYAIRLRDNTSTSTMTTDNLDLSSYDQLEVDFSFYAKSMENNEDFWLQISTDGGVSYTTVEVWSKGIEFDNRTRYDNNLAVINGPFTTTTRLRFRCDASSNSDYVYVDDVEIRGSSCSLEKYTLTTSAINGGISLSPSSEFYDEGSVVTVTAIPDDNYQFDSWGGDLTGNVNPIDITMTDNKSIVANFIEIGEVWNKIDDRDPRVGYTDFWGDIEGSGYYLDTGRFKEGVGGEVSCTFTGSQAKIFVLRIDEFATTIDVTLDGVYQGEFSLAAGPESVMEIYDSGKLSDELHTISFTNTSLELSFDYFEYLGSASSSKAKIDTIETEMINLDSIEFNIHPNPIVEKNLQIEIKGVETEVNVFIFSSSGGEPLVSRSFQVQESKKIQIGLEGLRKGLYFVQVISAEGRSVVKKMILE